mgnify:CR=1 FL=1
MIYLSDKVKLMELIAKLKRITRKQDEIETRLKQVESVLDSKEDEK